ncbi:GbsR/MarR family transcriptional regulator [Corynebacterium sp. A21]|uniref:GbsR/MarR family transcriptional regulator n=1 Tax=Corynebacterium sp. A21 TaxID=3457318 RepID=UPI003FCF2E07
MSTPAKDFTDTFARYWSANGGAEIQGRIVGQLMLDEGNGVSAAQLAEELAISRGSVSTAVRRLEQAGFIRRTRRPGSRADWFIMDDDVWAGFLEHEYNYLAAQRDLAAAALAVMPAESPARPRLRNMHDYMSWLTEELDLRSAWREHKKELAFRRRED